MIKRPNTLLTVMRITPKTPKNSLGSPHRKSIRQPRGSLGEIKGGSIEVSKKVETTKKLPKTTLKVP
jgi:hypothetical protein